MLSDLRFAFRSLRQHPGYALLAIAVLALGVGPTSALLSLADQLVFHPIPHVRDSGRLAVVDVGKGSPRTGWSPRSVSQVGRAARVTSSPAVDGLAGYWPPSSFSVAAERATPLRMDGQFVTADFFDVLGLRADLGRTFNPDENGAHGPVPVAVIGHDLWTGMLGRDPQVLGRTLRINSETFTIIGVLPEGFRGIEALSDVQLWLPSAVLPVVRHIPGPSRQDAVAQGMPYLVMRLAAGATFRQAEAQLRAAIPRAAATEGDELLADAAPIVFPGLGVSAFVRTSVDRTLRLLFGVGAMLLLIACANLANLALFRAVRRRGETAVRVALGAGTVRIARLRLAESVMIGLAGGAAGVVLAVWLMALFHGTRFLNVGEMPSFALDWRVVAATTGVAVTVGVLLGLLPVAVRERVELSTTLKGATRTGTAGRHLVRAALSAVQFALCLALLVATFLFVGALRNLYRVDLGFDPSHVTTFEFHLGDQGYSRQQTLAYYDQLLRLVRQLPGVSSASVSTMAPLTGNRGMMNVRLPGDDPEAGRNVAMNGITSGYLDVLEMTMLRGRPLTDEDLAAQGGAGPVPIVLSASLARQLFGDRPPVGRTLISTAGPAQHEAVVAGVAQDVRWSGPGSEPEPMIFLPLSLSPFLDVQGVLMVRSLVPASSLVPAIRPVAADLDPSVPLGRTETLDAVLGRWTSQQSLFSKVLSALSALAVLLAAVGLYGLVSQTVAERARELGIRMAVGAERRDILALVLRRAGGVAAIGTLAGLLVAAAVVRVIRSYLFGVQPLAPVFYLLAIGTLVVAAAVASYVPARRATRIDPVDALRAE